MSLTAFKFLQVPRWPRAAAIAHRRNATRGLDCAIVVIPRGVTMKKVTATRGQYTRRLVISPGSYSR